MDPFAGAGAGMDHNVTLCRRAGSAGCLWFYNSSLRRSQRRMQLLDNSPNLFMMPARLSRNVIATLLQNIDPQPVVTQA
jgi:hypothetical protein